MNQVLTATPAKLRSGDWGVRISSTRVSAGDPVLVTAKSGKRWNATVSKVVWSGNGVSICATGSTARSSYRPARPGCCADCGDLLQAWMDGYHVGLCHDCF